MFAALSRLMEAWGTDLTWGLSLYRRLRALGLVDVGMEGYVVVWESRLTSIGFLGKKGEKG